MDNKIEINKDNIIIHFDLNGTIIVIDSTDDINVEEMANMVVSKSIYGKIVNNNWVVNIDPYDMVNSISYYHYLKSINKNYKDECYKYTNKDKPGEKFRIHYDRIIEFVKSGKLLFESFLKVIEQYDNIKIVFRTFGLDRSLVIKELNERYNYNKKFMLGRIARNDKETSLSMENGTVVIGIDKINKYIINSEHNLCIIDDFKYWGVKHNREIEFGKQIVKDSNVKQIFFDDNDCVAVVDDKGKLCSDQSMFCKVNTIKALENTDYYINYIKLI